MSARSGIQHFRLGARVRVERGAPRVGARGRLLAPRRAVRWRARAHRIRRSRRSDTSSSPMPTRARRRSGGMRSGTARRRPWTPRWRRSSTRLGARVRGGAYGAYGDDTEYLQARGTDGAPVHQRRGGRAPVRAGNTCVHALGVHASGEYIMRAHAESAALAQQQQQQAERRRPAPLDLRRRRGDEAEFSPANIAVGVRGYRAQAAVGRLLSPTTTLGALPSPTGLGGMGMGMPEDDFHAAMRNDFGRALNRTAGDAETARVVGGMAPYAHETTTRTCTLRT